MERAAAAAGGRVKGSLLALNFWGATGVGLVAEAGALRASRLGPGGTSGTFPSASARGVPSR